MWTWFSLPQFYLYKCVCVCVCVWVCMCACVHAHVYWVLHTFFWPCPMTFRILVPGPGIEPRAAAARIPNPNDCTTRKLPSSAHFYHACRYRHWTVPSPTAHEEHMSKLDRESHVDSNFVRDPEPEPPSRPPWISDPQKLREIMFCCFQLSIELICFTKIDTVFSFT